MEIVLADADAEIEPVPTGAAGGRGCKSGCSTPRNEHRIRQSRRRNWRGGRILITRSRLERRRLHFPSLPSFLPSLGSSLWPPRSLGTRPAAIGYAASTYAGWCCPRRCGASTRTSRFPVRAASAGLSALASPTTHFQDASFAPEDVQAGFDPLAFKPARVGGLQSATSTKGNFIRFRCSSGITKTAPPGALPPAELIAQLTIRLAPWVFETRNRTHIRPTDASCQLISTLFQSAQKALSLYTQRGLHNRGSACASVSTTRLQGLSLPV
jgi:hypothetical protein